MKDRSIYDVLGCRDKPHRGRAETLNKRIKVFIGEMYFQTHVKPLIEMEAISEAEFVRRAIAYYVKVQEKQNFTQRAIERYAIEGLGMGKHAAELLCRKYKAKRIDPIASGE